MDAMRIDKWLWAARFFKTRTLAQEEVGLGRVLMDGQRMKASRDVRVGDRLTDQTWRRGFSCLCGRSIKRSRPRKRGPEALS